MTAPGHGDIYEDTVAATLKRKFVSGEVFKTNQLLQFYSLVGFNELNR